MDLGDLAGFGVNVGPGFGVDAQATQLAQASYITSVSVGAGFQTLRRLPVCIRTKSKAAAGPAALESTLQVGFRTRFWDFGGEVYPLLFGVHVYVNPAEALDLLAGIFIFDPKNDDLTIGY